MQEQGLTAWDKLFFMRHHGLPTRVLDWTDQLGMAIYFALCSAKAESQINSAIWVLNPWALNETTASDRDLYSPRYLRYIGGRKEEWDYEDYLIHDDCQFDWNGPVAIYPEAKNIRMKAQHGLFTIFGSDIRPLEQQCDAALRKIDIPSDAVPAGLEFLEDAGINASTAFPDLDGFAKYLKAQYEV